MHGPFWPPMHPAPLVVGAGLVGYAGALDPAGWGRAYARALEGYDHTLGVSINGEHRAYPLRILNAHEMANDVLGGEPFALAY